MDAHAKRAAIVMGAGTFVAAIATLVLIAWHFRIDALLHLSPSLPVMRYNTALALLGMGFGLVAVGARRPHLASGLALVPGLIGASALLQYAAGVDLHVDQWFMHDFLAQRGGAAQNRFPGRMAPATALCLASFAASILLGQRARPNNRIDALPATLCAALSTAALVAFALGLGFDSRHWLYAGMAVQTAALLAIGAFALLYWMVPPEDRNFAHFAAVGSGLGTFILVGMVWQGLDIREEQALRRHLAAQAVSIREELQQTLDTNARALHRMARRWETRGGTPQGDWESDAREHLAALPGLGSLAWVDSADRVRWVVPEGDPEGLGRLDLHGNPVVADPVRRARRFGEGASSRGMALADRQYSFLSVTPLTVAGQHDGFLLASYRSRMLVETVLLRQRAPGVQVELRQDDGVVFSDFPPGNAQDGEVIETIDLNRSRWVLRVRASPQLADQSHTDLPDVALWGGLLLSLLLAVSLDRGFLARTRARELERQGTVIHESEQKYRSLLDSMVEGLTVNQDERCVFANAALARLLGYSLEEVVGLHFSEFVGPDHLAIATERFRQRIAGTGGGATEPPRSYEVQFRRKDGRLVWVDLHGQLTEFNGRPAVQTLVRDIDDRKAVEAALRHEQQRIELVSRGAVDGIWDRNMETGEEYYSDRWFELLGYCPGERPQGDDVWASLLHPDDRDAVLQVMRRHLAMREPYDVECRMRTRTGEYRWYRSAGQATWDADGKPLRMAGSLVDIEARKHAEMALAVSEARFRGAMEHAAIGMALVSLEGRWLKVNKALSEIVGYTQDELMSRTFQDITWPDDLESDLACAQDLLAGRIDTYTMEKRYIRKDGEIVWVLLAVSLARDAEGQPDHFISQIENIDPRKRQEQQIREALQEKEMLLREVYHRVKNNLQVIRSLLNLQSRSLPEGAARDAMVETGARVRAMALVHEKLYRSGNLTRIALREFTEDLIEQIRESWGLDKGRVTIRCEIADLSMGLDTAIPLGLLMNELVSNSVKHAFPGARSGRILVRLIQRDKGAELLVDDDGIGLPPGFDATLVKSMGLRLATSLARQLGGALQFASGGGTRVRVVIGSLDEPVEAAADRVSLPEHLPDGTPQEIVG